MPQPGTVDVPTLSDLATPRSVPIRLPPAEPGFRSSPVFGLAPLDHDSGQHRGGRCQPRHLLFLAAISAIRFEPESKAFYERLRSRGKPHKVVLVAVMRKLVSVLTALLREDRLRQREDPSRLVPRRTRFDLEPQRYRSVRSLEQDGPGRRGLQTSALVGIKLETLPSGQASAPIPSGCTSRSGTPASNQVLRPSRRRRRAVESTCLYDRHADAPGCNSGRRTQDRQRQGHDSRAGWLPPMSNRWRSRGQRRSWSSTGAPATDKSCVARVSGRCGPMRSSCGSHSGSRRQAIIP